MDTLKIDLYIEYKPIEEEDDTEVNVIEGLLKPKGIGLIVLDLEDDTVQIHNHTFKQF